MTAIIIASIFALIYLGCRRLANLNPPEPSQPCPCPICSPAKALPVEGDFEGPIVVHLALGDRLGDLSPMDIRRAQDMQNDAFWTHLQRARKAGMN